eukprot:12557699-Alexandrium_andersonii.AAC.1
MSVQGHWPLRQAEPPSCRPEVAEQEKLVSIPSKEALATASTSAWTPEEGVGAADECAQRTPERREANLHCTQLPPPGSALCQLLRPS